ncbi:MAG: hypothetical protein ABIR47_11335 [Candidatus Kapaibacterium sp.]
MSKNFAKDRSGHAKAILMEKIAAQLQFGLLMAGGNGGTIVGRQEVNDSGMAHMEFLQECEALGWIVVTNESRSMYWVMEESTYYLISN